ncbi:hypothetical protein [Saliphagus sp. LR7]|uniref:hypothetical protein n=1 Tax=Saliphagus sp. LR7 TaxID=2282654 RepID=UPI000DF7CFA1|nr:hypothetical protein [Saliphagus sp. LR7]
MSASLDGSDRARRWLLGGVVAYFLLLGYAVLANDPIARLAAYALFGVIAVAIGVALLAQGPTDPIGAAGASFASGGVAQFVWIATGDPAFELLSTVGVFAGIGLYVYATRYRR